MAIGIDHPLNRNGNFVPYAAVCGPQGPILQRAYKIQRACLFLPTETASWLRISMVVGIDNLHIHIDKHAPYVEGCGPQGPIFKYKGPAFS